MKRMILSAATLAMLAAAAFANTFNQTIDTNWHENGNWSTGFIPNIGEDVIIPQGKTCIISTATGVCQTVDVTGDLIVTGSQMLQIRTPNSGSDIAITVNSTGMLRANDGVIRLEDASGDNIARITGTGDIWGGFSSGAGTLETSSDGNAIDHVHVASGTTVFGQWDINVSVDNDGTFSTGGDFFPMTFDHPSTVLTITGSGEFINGTSTMTFGCIDFDTGTLNATFEAAGGKIHFVGCNGQLKPSLLEASLIVDGGDMEFDDGFTMDGGSVTVSDGLLLCEGDTTLADTITTVDGIGDFGFIDARLTLNSGSSLVVEEDGDLDADHLYTGVVGDGITITIDDSGEFSCDYFEFDETDFTLLSGTFDVAGFGSNNTPSLASSTTAITISGGTFSIAWGYDGDGSELTLAGGTLEILTSADSNDTFFNDGDSLLLSGAIEVKEGEKLILD